ncbi:TMM72 protein, partial [Amia calva]|nr:TMM72 protein [Amia calva]
LMYFNSCFYGICIRCPSGSKAFILWKKTARFGGFQKFLYYTLMSVVCFLHPVLVWHAVIPGIMLLITALAYFILSKKKKAELPKDPATPSEHYSDPSATAVSLTEAGSTEQTYTFSAGKTKKTPLAYFQSLLKIQPPKDNIQEKLNQGTVDARSEVPASKGKKKQVHFEEHAVKIIPDEPEMVECQEMDEEETTSDKAPIIRA